MNARVLLNKSRLELAHLDDVIRIEDEARHGGLGDSVFIRSLFQTFLAHRERRLDNLLQAIHSGDMGAVRSHSHELKSACLAIGCERAAAISGKIEALARGDRKVRSRRHYLVAVWYERLATELVELDAEVRRTIKLP
ncbi:MAG: Hpt domain-containing protein [Bdellovibrionales bacterium]|nr:Hpt domain-containing protein [Bdellovibrionales bacterium]